MIVREQLTEHDRNNLRYGIDPSPYDPAYFEHEEIETHICRGIITYGYREHTAEHDGWVRLGPWLRIEEARKATER